MIAPCRAFLHVCCLIVVVGPDPVWQCGHLIGEEGASGFAFRWIVMCVVCPSLFTIPFGILVGPVVFTSDHSKA